MGFGGAQGDNTGLGADEQFPEIQEVIGISAPAMQQNEALLRWLWSQLELVGTASHGRNWELLLRRLDLLPTSASPWRPRPCSACPTRKGWCPWPRGCWQPAIN